MASSSLEQAIAPSPATRPVARSTRRILRRLKSGPRRKYQASRATEAWAQAKRNIDVGVPVHLPVAEEFGMLEPRNHAQHPRLLAKTHVVLKAHKVVASRACILLPELHHRVGAPSSARIRQAHRLHGSETQGIAAAPGDFLDRQARLEVSRMVLLDMRGHARGGEQGVDEGLVLIFVEGAIQIVARAVRLSVKRFSVPRCA